MVSNHLEQDTAWLRHCFPWNPYVTFHRAVRQPCTAHNSNRGLQVMVQWVAGLLCDSWDISRNFQHPRKSSTCDIHL